MTALYPELGMGERPSAVEKRQKLVSLPGTPVEPLTYFKAASAMRLERLSPAWLPYGVHQELVDVAR